MSNRKLTGSETHIIGSVVLGLGLRTPVAAQAKSDTKGGGNKTSAKTRIEILLHLFLSLYTL